MKIKTAGIILMWLASVGLACAGTNDITTLVQKGLFEEEANHHLDAAIEYYQEAIGHFDKDRQLTATAIFRLGECYRLQGKTNEANVQYERIVHEFGDQAQLVELSRGYLPKEMGHSSFVQNLTRISDGKPEISSEEQAEIQNINDMIQNSPDLINGEAHNGNTPLITAARHGWMQAAKLLLNHGAIVNPVPPNWTPLGMAADKGNKGMVELLLSNGASVNALDVDRGFAPLHYAVYQGFKTVVETLLAHGANADLPTHNGDRPLHVAASQGYTTMSEVLLAHHADVNASGKNGETAIFRAIQANHIEMVQFLISNKANVNFKTESGKTPLHAGLGGDTGIAIVKVLLDSGADVEASFGGHAPLYYAFMNSRFALASLLLQKNANPNLTINNDYTLLDTAIASRTTNNIIEELILHHADVNAPDQHGDPPLAYASRLGGDDGNKIKQMLIEAGADEDYQRRGGIFIAQKGTGSIGTKVFSKGTNSINRYTLFELIASVYRANGSHRVIAFPDLAHATIDRLKADGSKGETAVDLGEILQSGDCSKDLWLEWGDVVQIPQLDHKLYENWKGLSQTIAEALEKCLMRKVDLVVKGETTKMVLVNFINGYSQPAFLSDALKSCKLGDSFNLSEVVYSANVLLISSDLGRVKVTRRVSEAGKPKVMEFNLETLPRPDFWLRDGDVIEIPERDQK